MSACIQNSMTQYHPHDSVADTVRHLWRQWQDRSEERNSYVRLTDRDILDIGHSRFEIERELAKPFWRG